MKNYIELFKESKTLNQVYWFLGGFLAILICWFLFSKEENTRRYLIIFLMIGQTIRAFLIINKIDKYYRN